MKKLYCFTLTAMLAVLGTNCSPSKKTAAPPPAPVLTSASPATAEHLAEGKTLWETHCIKCHKLYLPESRSREKWEKVLPRMYRLAKTNEYQSARIHAYILSNISAQ